MAGGLKQTLAIFGWHSDKNGAVGHDLFEQRGGGPETVQEWGWGHGG